MAIDGNEIISTMRKMTGRMDASDPLFTDAIMLDYAQKFINLNMPFDIKLYELKTWYEFNIDETTDTYAINLQNLRLANINPPAYVDGFLIEWYQSPSLFYAKWPETQTYTSQRPTDVLYYNNELIFRGPPDQEYPVKIAAYRLMADFGDPNPNEDVDIEFDYLMRYIACGASLDIFTDYGELDMYEKYYGIFMRYKSLVIARTNKQLSSQRSVPNF